MTTSPIVSAGRADAPTILARIRDLTEPVMRSAVDRLEPWLSLMGGYHLGWRTTDGLPANCSPGKLVRPALAVLAAEAVGAEPEVALPGAAAVELVHNFSLVHDDIMDGDEQRRGRPAVWHVYGPSAAILVGDALHALAFELLCGCSPDDGRNVRAGRHLATAMLDLVAGQAQDIKFSLRPWQGSGAVTVAEYRTMAAAKTGALLAAAAAIGAELGGAPADTVACLYRVGMHLGLAFQCVDDILGISGDPEITGKPVLGDLREGKKTLPILGALAAGMPASAELLAALARPARSDDCLRRMAVLVEQAGGRSFARHEAATHLDQAHALLAQLEMPMRVRAEFDVLLDALTDRAK